MVPTQAAARLIRRLSASPVRRLRRAAPWQRFFTPARGPRTGGLPGPGLGQPIAGRRGTLQTRFLHDRLQRCRGELSQIIGMVHDLERAEAPGQNAPGGMRAGWSRYQPSSTFSGGFAAAGGRQHQSHQMAMLERIRQVADRCAATLSEVEREVDVLTGSGHEITRQPDRWQSPMWSARSSWSSSAGAAHGQTWIGDHGRSAGFAPPQAVYGRDQAAAPSHDDASYFARPGLRGRAAFSRPLSMPASQQGGFDYGFAGASAWRREPVMAGRSSGRY